MDIFNEKYYKPIKIVENLWSLGTKRHKLHLLIDDEKSVLFEVGVIGMVHIILKQLEELKVNLSYIVLMHPHNDHLTGIEILKEKYPNAKIIIGKDAIEFIMHPKSFDILIRETKYMNIILEKENVYCKYDIYNYLPNLDGSIEIEDKKEIKLKNYTVEIKKTNGHSPGHLFVYIKELKTMIESDSLGTQYKDGTNFPMFFVNYNKYIEAIKKIEKYDINILLSAHKDFIKGNKIIKKYIKNSSVYTTNLKEKLINFNYKKRENWINNAMKLYSKEAAEIMSPENMAVCFKLLLKRSLE